MTALLRRILGSALGGTTLIQGMVLLAGVASGITLARSLGPQGRGELAVFILWAGILSLLGDLGLGFALCYQAGKGVDRIDDLWTIAIIGGSAAGAVFGLAGWLTLPHFVESLRTPAAQVDLAIAILSVPVILVNGAEGYLLLGRNLLHDYNSSRIATSVSYLIAVGYVAIIAPTVHNFVLAYLAGQAAGLGWCTLLVARRLRPRFHFNRRIVPGIVSYGIKAQMASIAAQTNLRADQAVMSVLLTPTQLGLYVVAVSIAGVLSPLMNAITIVILPRAARSASNEGAAILIARHVKLAGIIAIPAVFAGLFVMPWILPAFFGRGFAAAVGCAQILLFASIFQGFDALLGNGLRGLGRPGLPAAAEGAGMAVTLLLLLLLLPRLGIAGAAVASLTAYVLVAVVELRAIGRIAGISTRQLMAVPSGFPTIENASRFFRNAITKNAALASPRRP